MKIETKDTEGRVNGWLAPIWNALEQPELRPEQVYLTAIAPHSRKGPHLHMHRRGLFFCVIGKVLVRIRRSNGSLFDIRIGMAVEKIDVPPGYPCALYNYGDTEALVLNMPSPAWSKDNPDDWPVENWQDPEDWNGK